MPLRWRVALLVGIAIAISYLDRQSLPVAVGAIQRDIPLTNTQFGALNSTFLLAYALAYAGGGALIDRLGTLDLGFGYQSVFSVVGTLHVIGFCVILLTIRRIRPLSTPGE